MDIFELPLIHYAIDIFLKIPHQSTKAVSLSAFRNGTHANLISIITQRPVPVAQSREHIYLESCTAKALLL